MNHLRDEISDAVIELVFLTFPSTDDKDFRAFVQQALTIVDYAVAEAMKAERHVRYLKNLTRSKN